MRLFQVSKRVFLYKPVALKLTKVMKSNRGLARDEDNDEAGEEVVDMRQFFELKYEALRKDVDRLIPMTDWANMALPNPADVELPSMPRWQRPMNQADEETRMNKLRERHQVPAPRSQVLPGHFQFYAEMGRDDE